MRQKKVDLEYHSCVRKEVLPFMKREPGQRILEIGCGTGRTLAHLKKNGYASYVAGIERVEACRDSADPLVDELMIADVESFDFKFKEKFDCVLLLDVVEHLYDPYALIRRVEEVLAPSGTVVVSIPNIRNWGILKRLVLKGTWEYADKGILDRTHIRFFTKKSFLASIKTECPSFRLLDYGANMENNAGLLSRVSFLKEFFVCQHVFKLGLRQ